MNCIPIRLDMTGDVVDNTNKLDAVDFDDYNGSTAAKETTASLPVLPLLLPILFLSPKHNVQ